MLSECTPFGDNEVEEEGEEEDDKICGRNKES
jgi:hypothetical protein